MQPRVERLWGSWAMTGTTRYNLEDVAGVEQGHIDSPPRGFLWVQKPGQRDKARLGGYVDVLVRGMLQVSPGQDQ